MEVTDFFELFMKELKINTSLSSYYKFHKSNTSFEFRKAYFCQRLQYIKDNIEGNNLKIWDCGCGYGTTAIFLALNGIPVYGSTLEFYIKEIPKRLEFYSAHGNVDLFTYSYENIFDSHPEPNSQDIIIIQDTMHHLEPLQGAITILKKVLKPSGKMILIEENGSNVVQNLKLYLRRGNKRIIEIYDDRLNKKIILGNENIRNLSLWKKEFSKQGFDILPEKTQYIRFYPPFFFKNGNTDLVLEKEQQLWKKNSLLKEKLFFGLNFIVKHKEQI